MAMIEGMCALQNHTLFCGESDLDQCRLVLESGVLLQGATDKQLQPGKDSVDREVLPADVLRGQERRSEEKEEEERRKREEGETECWLGF